ncbi:MAG: hypothetical protein ACLGQU_08545 [Acidobacteriota bacterium]
MTRSAMKYLGPVIALTALFGARAGATTRELDANLPPGTAIPIEFTHTVRADKAKIGDIIEARTMQVVYLGHGRDLPKGSYVLGHVVKAQPVRPGVSASVLAIRFDRIVVREGAISARLYVRALTNTMESSEASYPVTPSYMDQSNQRVLIGGDQISRSTPSVYSSVSEDEGLDVVGQDLRDGVFERLRPAETLSGRDLLRCNGTAEVQSVGIYSGSACGLYGFDMTSLTHTGRNNRGIVELSSKYFTIKLYAGSTALLQAAPDSIASKPAAEPL